MGRFASFVMLAGLAAGGVIRHLIRGLLEGVALLAHLHLGLYLGRLLLRGAVVGALGLLGSEEEGELGLLRLRRFLGWVRGLVRLVGLVRLRAVLHLGLD